MCLNAEPENEIKFVGLSTSNVLLPSGYLENKIKSKMGKPGNFVSNLFFQNHVLLGLAIVHSNDGWI